MWKVEINSGARTTLVADGLRKQIWRPMAMNKEDFYHFLPKGKLVSEEALNAMFDMRQ
jgi:hypothetical protein